MPNASPAVASLEGATVSTASVEPTGANLDVSTLGPQGNIGTYAVEKLTEEEAIAQGYTVIKTAEELVALNTNVANKKFILMGDIDPTGVTWTSKTLAVGAEFNGNGYSIKNLTGTQGLFSGNYGTIKNLNIANAQLNPTAANSGILAGQNYSSGTIENCFVQGSIISTAGNVGGLVGRNYGTIKNASAAATVEGTVYVGGLVGNNSATTAIIENCSATGSVTASSNYAGGLVGYNYGTIKNVTATADVNSTSDYVGGLVGSNGGTIVNASTNGTVDGNNHTGGLVGANWGGTISNVIASGAVNGMGNTGGLVGISSGVIENASATGAVNATGSYSGGLVGNSTGTIINASASGDVTGKATTGGLVGYNFGSITNASASGDVDGTGIVGGLVGKNQGEKAIISNASASGNVTAIDYNSGGLIGTADAGRISNSYALGNVSSEGLQVGGFSGSLGNTIVTNCYAKGDVEASNNYVGGFIGYVGKNNTVQGCYSTGDVSQGGGFIGYVGSDSGATITDSYTTGTVEKGSAFVFSGINNATFTNVYSNSDQPAGVTINQAGVTAMPKDWFEDSENLTFLGDGYDYYYNPPEIKGNSESYASEFIKFQIGANEGKDNMLSLNLTFKMNFFSADVSSIEKASATLEKVDEFKQTLTEKRAEIGAARNRLESVIESQNVRLENLEASHSTMVDTDFAFEAANLTKMQILQNTTATLLAQANTLPSLALQLLG